MTAQTVSQAVAKRDASPAELVRQSRPWFATIVPSHIDANAFVALAQAYLRKNPKLAAAAQKNPQSFMAALSECARLGLVPGDTYHCVPFEDRRNGTVEITGIVDYKGEIELIYRAGAVSSVKAEIVCKKDHFRYATDMDRPEHEPDWFGDRGDLIGAYAYAVMKDGATSKVVIYSKAEIDRVKAVSKGADRADSPWKTWYDRMALKTVLHRLEHFVPTSAEYRREQLRAAAEVSQQVNSTATVTTHPAAVRPGDPEYVDAELVDDTPDPSPPAHAAPSTPGAAPATAPVRPGAGGEARNGAGLSGDVTQHLARLAGDDEPGQLILAAQILALSTPPESVRKLTVRQQRQLLATLERCGDIDDLHRLMSTGEAAERDAVDGQDA